jgi:hypothetical protein
MEHKTKEMYLGQELDGITLLSKMYATVYFREATATHNKKVFNYLYKVMRKNLPETPTDGVATGEDMKFYVKLSPNSEDKFVAEAMHIMPYEVKKMLEKNPLYVREDWLAHLFGIKEMSLTDTRLVKFLPFAAKKVVLFAENLLKFIAGITKINIVVRTPAVLIGNIISNINYSVVSGHDLPTVIATTFKNAGYLRDYLNNKKALADLLVKIRVKKASQAEEDQVTWYRSKLANSPLHEFVEMGLFTNITEDIVPTDIKINSNFVTKYANLIADKLPSPVKKVGSQIYMLKGTPVFEFLMLATQYSDFIAKMTHYQLSMKNAPKETEAREKYKKKLKIEVLNAFINYDKPVSALEQWLNDAGFLFFTKFIKRIQHVIIRQGTEHPVTAALFLMLQYSLWDTEDIYETFGKPNLSARMNFAPFAHIPDILTPSSYEIMKDII